MGESKGVNVKVGTVYEGLINHERFTLIGIQGESLVFAYKGKTIIYGLEAFKRCLVKEI